MSQKSSWLKVFVLIHRQCGNCQHHDKLYQKPKAFFFHSSSFASTELANFKLEFTLSAIQDLRSCPWSWIPCAEKLSDSISIESVAKRSSHDWRIYTARSDAPTLIQWTKDKHKLVVSFVLVGSRSPRILRPRVWAADNATHICFSL
jgi:hypothetical protein